LHYNEISKHVVQALSHFHGKVIFNGRQVSFLRPQVHTGVLSE